MERFGLRDDDCSNLTLTVDGQRVPYSLSLNVMAVKGELKR